MTMTSITLGPCPRLRLFGGGRTLLDLAVWAKARGLDVAVTTAPRHADDDLGEGRSLATALTAAGIPFETTETMDEKTAMRAVGGMDGTFAVSLSAAWIFKPAVIEGAFKSRLFNLHGARLPQGRGGGGFSWDILSGNRFGFCVLHQVDGGVDTGPVLAHREFLYPGACRIPADYLRRYDSENLDFIRSIVDDLARGPRAFPLDRQPEYLSTYWPRLHTPTQAWIDWSMPVGDVERFVCAFDDPYFGARTAWNGLDVRLKGALTSFGDGVFHPFQAGIVYRANDRWLCVAANGGTLIVERVLDADGRDIRTKIRPGDRFHTPGERLDSRAARPVYTPTGLKAP